MILYDYGSSEEENHQKCVCKKGENMEHIYYCDSLNKKKTEEIYQQIFQGGLGQQIAVFERFEENFKKRMELLEDDSDPLYSDLYSNEYGNG